MSQLHENSEHQHQQAINLDNLQSSKNEFYVQGEQNDSMRKDDVEKRYEQIVQVQNQNVVRDQQQQQVQQARAEEQQQEQQAAKQQAHQHHQINFILDRFRASKHQSPSLDKSSLALKSISKQQRLYKMIPSLFSIGCKNRSRMVKGKTFDQIQDQLKFMDLEKFVNFCTDFQIHKLFQRQILIKAFKKYAINRLTLDQERFRNLIKNLVEKNPSLLALLLQNEDVLKVNINKSKFQKILTERQTALSKYNYKLRPINGKDIESIEQDLKEKKQIKELLRKEKQQSMIIRRKLGINDHNKRKVSKNNAISESKLSVLSPNQISRWVRKPKQRNYSEKFNPESLVTNIINGDDEYLDEYQARIWKKESDNTAFIPNNQAYYKPPSTNESILETALSKRIERGNKVIKKITSSYLKNYV